MFSPDEDRQKKVPDTFFGMLVECFRHDELKKAWK